jgi:UDP-galactose transporter B1
MIVFKPPCLFSHARNLLFILCRYVIYPIQVLAKSCKPVPVMLMGAAMGKVYPARKYANVVMIVLGVALFMGAGTDKKKSHSSASDGGDDSDGESNASPSQLIGIVLLFVSLCFDGGTGAYEDKLMSVHSVQPFDLMYNIQLGKTILAFIGLLVLNQLHIFIQMVQEMGFLLVALGLSGALGQVFIFVTIAKFGALTCSIIGLARKVTTLVASIYFYGHHLNSLQFMGLMISVGAMVINFLGKKGGGHGQPPPKTQNMPEEMQKMLDDEAHDDDDDEDDDDDSGGDVELAASPKELV